MTPHCVRPSLRSGGCYDLFVYWLDRNTKYIRYYISNRFAYGGLLHDNSEMCGAKI